MIFLKVGAMLINMHYVIDIIPSKSGSCKIYKLDGSMVEAVIGDKYTDCLDFTLKNLIRTQKTDGAK